MNEHNTQNQENQNAANYQQPTTSQKSSLIPIAIVIGVILAGGIYAYFKVQEAAYPGPSNVKIKSPKHVNKGGEMPIEYYAEDPYLQMPESTSSDPAAIEADLDVTDLDAIEQDLQVLDQI